jgi:DNA modification methylase
MQIEYLSREALQTALEQTASESLDFAVLATGALEHADSDRMKSCLSACARALRKGGLLFVQGRPEYLPELGVFLDGPLNFKYWIAVESLPRKSSSGLPSVHAGILLFSKGNHGFGVNRTRFPHQVCEFCGRSLRDWGGKSHLMNPAGHVISDVWTDLPPADNYTHISPPVLETILRMVDSGDRQIRGIVGPSESPDDGQDIPESPSACMADTGAVNSLDDTLVDVVHCGDALEILRSYPDGCVDLAFADPPYNLNKLYSAYQDGRSEERYVEWCNAWLAEYARVLKPTGSLYVLNLPRWTMYHAEFLNQHLCFRSWIVWDALSEPRGKLMPAHYGLLFYTKQPTGFTVNDDALSSIDSRRYCLRASCIRKRKSLGADEKEPLTDIWWDIHRIRHKRDRDYHPCQLPDALMERIIRLSTNEGDVVLDALCGAGTTPLAARRLNRRYVAIDLDPNYVAITRDKLRELDVNGSVQRESTRKPKREHSKRELQLQLRNLAAHLGRLPTPDDVRDLTDYDPAVILSLFPTWGKALKAAKLETAKSAMQ